MSAQQIFLSIATLTAALMAGLFYAYSCSVSPGLAKMPDAAFLSAFQSINRAIQNPVFFLSFFGTIIMIPIAGYMHYSRPVQTQFVLISVAFAVYMIGAFGVTVFGNIPLNNALDALDIDAASANDLTAFRARFEPRWTVLNNIRTLASAVAALLLIIACVKQQNS